MQRNSGQMEEQEEGIVIKIMGDDIPGAALKEPLESHTVVALSSGCYIILYVEIQRHQLHGEKLSHNQVSPRCVSLEKQKFYQDLSQETELS